MPIIVVVRILSCELLLQLLLLLLLLVISGVGVGVVAAFVATVAVVAVAVVAVVAVVAFTFTPIPYMQEISLPGSSTEKRQGAASSGSLKAIRSQKLSCP